MTRAKRGRLESGTHIGNAQETEEPEVTRNEQESVEIITIDG